MAFDKGYAEYYDMFNSGKNYDNEVMFLDKIFKEHDVTSFLDLGCGTGVHAEKMTGMGYDVTGLDISPDMIKVAKEKEIDQAEFIVGDMTNFNLNKKFDACTIMFAAFGYLTENKQLEDCLKCISEHLTVDGILTFDCWNGLGVMRDLPSSRVKEVELDGTNIRRTSHPTMRAINQVCDIKFDVEVSKDGEIIKEYKEDHSMRFFFPMELKKYLEDAGFEVLRICKDFDDKEDLDENSWNMSVIAMKV